MCVGINIYLHWFSLARRLEHTLRVVAEWLGLAHVHTRMQGLQLARWGRKSPSFFGLQIMAGISEILLAAVLTVPSGIRVYHLLSFASSRGTSNSRAPPASDGISKIRLLAICLK